ncbi:MAG: anhydro-N-acetylmuramic acid kinase, partial [Deinococcus sp.]
MSGTSADGIDAALLELPGWPALGGVGGAERGGSPMPALARLGDAPRGQVIAHTFTPYPPALRGA